jgi:hypothetical protein
MRKYISKFRILFIMIFLIIPENFMFAQNISRALRNYEEGDLQKAYELLSKGIKSDSTNTTFNFGLALVFSNLKFESRDYFVAWKYLQKADENFDKMNQDDLKTLAEFLLNLEQRKTNRTVRQKFDIHKKAIEDKLIKYVREENDIVMINSFIQEFPNSKFYENVIHIRNYIAYSKVASDNTLDGYNGFIKDFPDAAQIPQAISKRNKLAFDQAKASGNIEALNDFLKMYPNADQKNDALKLRNELAFQQAKKLNTIEGYEVFIHTYPDAVQVSTALKLQKQLVFEKAKSINTFEAYADFLRRYPEAEQYVDVFNLMANSLGEAILKEVKYPNASIEWIKAFDNYGKNDHAVALCPYPDGTLAMVGTTTDDSLNVTQGWFVKFDSDWKMRWAKNYGNRLGIALSTAVSTASGDIFACGYDLKNPIIRDSSAWYIKLNVQGLKYFDKETEANAILSASVAPSNQLIFSGCHADTSGKLHYWIMESKESGKKIWSRIYTGNGQISNVKCDQGGKIYASCGRWVIKTDPEGYLQWEFLPEPGDSILKLELTKTGELYLAGLNRSKQLVLIKLNASGKQSAKYTITAISEILDIANLKLSTSNELVVGVNTSQGAVLIRLNDKGQILSDMRFNSLANRVKDFTLMQQGGTILLLENNRKQTGWDILLIKLK